jgi:sporulation protein YlmC with PRC-barrel domain
LAIPKIQHYEDAFGLTLDGQYIGHISDNNFNFYADCTGGHISCEIFSPIVDITVGNYRLVSYQDGWSKFLSYKVLYADSGEMVKDVRDVEFDGKTLTLHCFESWPAKDIGEDETRDYTIEVKVKDEE